MPAWLTLVERVEVPVLLEEEDALDHGLRNCTVLQLSNSDVRLDIAWNVNSSRSELLYSIKNNNNYTNYYYRLNCKCIYWPYLSPCWVD